MALKERVEVWKCYKHLNNNYKHLYYDNKHLYYENKHLYYENKHLYYENKERCTHKYLSFVLDSINIEPCLINGIVR